MKTLVKTDGLFPTMNNVMDDFFSTEMMEWNGRSVSNVGRTLPFVNIKETPKEYTIDLAVPGFKKEDFKIEHTNHILTVCSKHEEEKMEKDVEGTYTRKEFSYNSFYRSFTLPETANNDEIHATYKEGILSVVVVKKPVSSPNTSKAITIK
jgi:HSP20 family protein